MAERFFISDTHFSHARILEFESDDGRPVRSGFSSVEEMDEAIVERWNSVVGPKDKVYHLGDVAIPRRGLKMLDRLNGKGRLVRGNHDIFRTQEYMGYFEEIHGVLPMMKFGFVCSHVPLHPDMLDRWKKNVHGHLHERTMKDPRYLCVSVEQINYTPIHIDEVLARLNDEA